MSGLQEHPEPIIVTVNAGGKLFQTYQETLVRGSPYFQAYFESGFSKPDPRKPIFLDMDPECFRHLLMRMRLPGYDGNITLPGIREAAAFLGMQLPPSLQEIKQQTKQAVYDLAMRLQKGDRVILADGRFASFDMYDADHLNSWRFDLGASYMRYKDLWSKGQPQFRVTDATQWVKIMAREPERNCVVFDK